MITGIVFGLCQAICWASTSIFLRRLSARLDPYLVNGLRAAIGLLIIVPLMFITGGVGDYGKLTALRLVYLLSSVIVGGVFGDSLYVSALKTLGVTRAFPITNGSPIFAAIFGLILLGEEISATTYVGMAFVLFGVYLVARPRGHVQSGPAETIPRAQMLRGVIYASITASLWGLAAVLVALGLEGINSSTANTVRVPVVVLISLAVAGARGQFGALRTIDRKTFRNLFIAGILGWGLGGSLYVAAVQLAGPSKTAIMSSTAPLFAVPLSMIFLKERPGRYVALGTVISVLGVVLVIV